MDGGRSEEGKDIKGRDVKTPGEEADEKPRSLYGGWTWAYTILLIFMRVSECP